MKAKAASVSQPRARPNDNNSNTGNEFGATWNEGLSLVSSEAIQQLPQHSQHNWQVMALGGGDVPEAMGVFDVTNKLRGESHTGRCAGMGPRASNENELLRMLWATMLVPTSRDDSNAFYQPRWPGLILVDRELVDGYENRSALQFLQQKMLDCHVILTLNTEEHLNAIRHGDAESRTTRSSDCTWHARARATVERIKQLPQNRKETWKCAVFVVDREEGSPDRFLLAVVDPSKPESASPIGMGTCVLPTVNDLIKGIQACMAAPIAETGAPRRPRRLLLDVLLEAALNDVKSYFETSRDICKV